MGAYVIECEAARAQELYTAWLATGPREITPDRQGYEASRAITHITQIDPKSTFLAITISPTPLTKAAIIAWIAGSILLWEALLYLFFRFNHQLQGIGSENPQLLLLLTPPVLLLFVALLLGPALALLGSTNLYGAIEAEWRDFITDHGVELHQVGPRRHYALFLWDSMLIQGGVIILAIVQWGPMFNLTAVYLDLLKPLVILLILFLSILLIPELLYAQCRTSFRPATYWRAQSASLSIFPAGQFLVVLIFHICLTTTGAALLQLTAHRLPGPITTPLSILPTAL